MWGIAVLGAAALGIAGCDDSGGAADVDLALRSLDRLLEATPPNGRLPGSNQLIAELVRDQFREVGVVDVTIEEFSIPVSAATTHSLELSGADAIAGARDHLVNVFAGDGMVEGAALIDVGSSTAPVPEAAGKIALLDFSVTRSLRTQYRNVIASGAVGAIIDSKLDAVRQRSVWNLAGVDQIDGPIPVVTIDQGAAAAVREQLALGADVRVDLASDAAVSPLRAYNVIARIPGTVHPERTLLVNGHLDSWFAGAADDGQAIAALIALAKVFTEHPLPYTIELVAFDCEETSSLGANNYIMRRLPAVRDTLVGAISLEMLAPKHPELTIVTLDPMDVWLPAVEAGGLTDLFKISLTPADQMIAFGGEVPSDQGNFWQFGVPGFFVVASYNEYHSIHDDAQNTDDARFGKVLAALEKTLREIGTLSPETLAVRPNSSIHVQVEVTERLGQRVSGVIGTTNAQTEAPVEDATVRVTLFNEGYDTILGSTAATFVPGTGYTFSVDHAVGDGTSSILSIDAVITGRASGRALLRLD